MKEEDLRDDKKKSGRPIKHPDIEEELRNYIFEHRKLKLPVPASNLILKGRQLASAKSYQDLRFSSSWLKRFMKRNHLSIRKITGNSNKEVEEIKKSAATFRERIFNLIQDSIYDHDFVINIDETSLPIDLPTKTTIEVIGTKHIDGLCTGKDKSHLTIILTIAKNGKKFKPVVLLPGKGTKAINIPTDIEVIYPNQQKSWNNQEIMSEYIKRILKEIIVYLPPYKKSLLLMDSSKIHTKGEILKEISKLGFQIEIIPPGTTGLVQPLDVSVNHPFKSYYSQCWQEWLEKDGINHKTESGNIKSPKNEMILMWISKSWHQINPETIRNGFKMYEDISDVKEGKIIFLI